jgi:1-acyl-sn-glycerol-3-phosphate acyltransferase
MPMQRSLPNRIWQTFVKSIARLIAVTVFRVRASGRELIPRSGGGLVLSNHQSNLDPVLVGLASDRRLNYVARDTLFNSRPFRWLLNSFDAIPIARDGMSLGGIKETLKRLKRGEMVLLFPEGTRTRDGQVQEMKPGFCAIARRAEVPLIPVAIAGAFEAWPRHRTFPRASVIRVAFGRPIEPAEFAAMTDEQLVHELERRIRACHADAFASRVRATWPSAVKLASGEATR